MEEKKDLRVLRTVKTIKDTVKEMICEMDASEITIVELTKRASIHRKTFYLHYDCIEDLFRDLLNEIAESYYLLLDSLPPDASFTEVNRILFKFLSEQEIYVEKLICSGAYRNYADDLFSIVNEHNQYRFNLDSQYTKEECRIIDVYMNRSSISMYRAWVADGKKLPLEKITELSGKLVTYGVSSVL